MPPEATFATDRVITHSHPCDVRRWHRQPIVDLLAQVAAEKRATPAQIALAWVLAQQPWIVPLPGTRKLERLDENIGATTIELSIDDLRTTDAAAATIAVRGARGSGHERYG